MNLNIFQSLLFLYDDELPYNPLFFKNKSQSSGI